MAHIKLYELCDGLGTPCPAVPSWCGLYKVNQFYCKLQTYGQGSFFNNQDIPDIQYVSRNALLFYYGLRVATSRGKDRENGFLPKVREFDCWSGKILKMIKKVRKNSENHQKVRDFFVSVLLTVITRNKGKYMHFDVENPKASRAPKWALNRGLIMCYCNAFILWWSLEEQIQVYV